jgi:hypothetical protein
VPWAQVPNLAGSCLRSCLRRLPEDFQERYGWRPVRGGPLDLCGAHAGSG